MGRKLDRYLSASYAPGRFRVEFRGFSIGAERSNGGRYTGVIEIEDGSEVGLEVWDRREDGSEHSNVWDHGCDSAILDAIAPRRAERYGNFRRILPELADAICAADPAAEARRNSPRQLALDLADRVPAGTRKEDFLPFVTAVLQHLCDRQRGALGRDEAAASFAIAGEQLQYLADFRRLTGRDFDPASDQVTRAEVDALPPVPRAPSAAPEYKCLECGAVYDRPEHVEAGGMGCDRCNGETRRDWRRHLVTAEAR
jgi:hypothetical protein